MLETDEHYRTRRIAFRFGRTLENAQRNRLTHRSSPKPTPP